MRSVTAVEAAYLAGLMDGEAYVGITRSTTSQSAKGCRRGVAYRVMVSISMTDKRPLLYAQRVAGVGQVRARKKSPDPAHRPAWVWNVWSKEAATLLSRVAPHMRVKREAAMACIEFQSLMRLPGRNGLTDAEWVTRERLWRKTRVRI